MVQASAMEAFDVRETSAPLTTVPQNPSTTDRVLIARGGMADVFVVDGEEGAVVLKRVREDLNDTRFVGQLVAEAELTARLRHPNIVRCHGLAWEQDGQPTMTMELVEGLDLEALLRACSKRRLVLPLSHRLAVVCAVLRALDHAHRSRDDRGALFELVHRDVSPSNVLVGFGGEVKLCDFGIAQSTMMPHGRGPRVEGKASYMSPEQAQGEAVDARADVFSAGVLLWELIAGRRMRRRQDGERIEQARSGAIPTLPKKGIAGEAALHAIARRALAQQPGERYANAGLMMRDLERWCRKHHLLVGESELGRFMRAHFAAERTTIPSRPPPRAAKVIEAPVVCDEEALAPPPRALRSDRAWWRDLPILVVSAAITFVVMSALV